jgi:autotransporter-associated beta strand protein
MLLINGALAVFNGLLVATGKFWCECVRGGICCGGECRCDEGECCDEVWHPDSEPDGFCCADQWFVVGEECPEGFAYYEIIRDQFRCCTCISEEIVDAQQGPDDVYYCCDETGAYPANENAQCKQRCCDGLACQQLFSDECQHTSIEGSCLALGCPASCCTESDDGAISCESQDSKVCENVTKGIVDEEPCESACKGACCIDGELTENSPTTQAECDAVGGCWWGIGSTVCGLGFCRDPFDADCCETVKSSAAKLTFKGPRKRQCPEPDVCGFQVTVTVTTGQPVYIHGGLFGSPYEACTDIVTFLLCNDEFYVTPAPCSGSLDNLDIEVCWEAADTGPETLRFHCCSGTYLLGNCACDCTTTLLYEGGGCTSNAVLQLRGDANIEASGTGPLVLTENITHDGSCERTLSLIGTSAHQNTLSGSILDGPGTSVDKSARGLWRLSSASGYSGRLRVIDGTLVIAANVPSSGASPFGTATNVADLPQVGTDLSLRSDQEALLLAEGGITISRGFAVVAGPGVVVLGMTGSGTATFANGVSIRLGRDVTLSASTGGEVIFASDWKDSGGGDNPAVAFDIGRADNLGTVVLEAFLPESITIVDLYPGATAKLNGGNETIYHETPVVLGLGSTLDLNGTDQPLDSLTLKASDTTVTGGTLVLDNSQVEVDGTGGGHDIESDVDLVGSATFEVPNPASLTVSGDISGSGGLVKTGSGTLTISGANTYTGQTSIAGGTLVVEKEFAGSADISLVTFTPTTLVVAFTMTPTSGATYKLLGGSTLQTYGAVAVTLTGAGGATGTYDSSTSTLTID